MIATLGMNADPRSLAALAQVLGLRALISDRSRLLYRFESQQPPVASSGIFGTKLERSGSAQTFVKVQNPSGDVVRAGYLNVSRKHDRVNREEGETCSCFSGREQLNGCVPP